MTINTTCPYCGSENVTTEIALKVTGTLKPDGTVELKQYWNNETLKEAVAETPAEFMDGFCKECGRNFPFSWKKGYYQDLTDRILYLVEYGKIINKNHKNYNKYNIVYDKNRGYYDFKQYFTLNPADEIAKFKEKYKINDKTDNYYFIISEQAVMSQLPENFNINQKPNGCNYNPIRIAYYEGRENGKPFYITNAPINNALLNKKPKHQEPTKEETDKTNKEETIENKSVKIEKEEETTNNENK